MWQWFNRVLLRIAVLVGLLQICWACGTADDTEEDQGECGNGVMEEGEDCDGISFNLSNVTYEGPDFVSEVTASSVIEVGGRSTSETTAQGTYVVDGEMMLFGYYQGSGSWSVSRQ